MTTKANNPAFPGGESDNGLTVREYFAAAALAGLVTDGIPKKDAADFAVIVADQLIEALNGAT